MKDNGWNVTTSIMFTPDGINAIFTNTTKNVSMAATYVRAVDPWTLKKGKLKMIAGML